MANTKNLKPFPKGVSGNPGGRPRRSRITDALLETLGEPCPTDKARRTYAEVIADKMLRAACGGDIRAAREITDRTEGRVAIAEAQPPGRGGLGLTIEELDALVRSVEAKTK